MKKHTFSLAVVAFALSLAGCGSSALPDVARDRPLDSRLGDSIDLSLADLLKKPRSQLAEMANECATKIQHQEKGRREGRLPFTLTPTLRLPLAVPVFREAQYSAQLGFSLPPYVHGKPGTEASKDSPLALHLARHGDSEAANKLLEPGDSNTSRQIQESRFERVYPVEWTRLVGLLLHDAQMRLATGDVDGGTELVVLHRQLRALLDPKAAKGMLGAVLLSRGHETLARAAAAWRKDKREGLAAQAEAILADWGEVPSLLLPFRIGTPRAEVTRLLRTTEGGGRGAERAAPSAGRCVLAAPALRAFDLLALPFPDEGAEAVLACLDDAGRLAEVLITYRTGFAEYFPEPAQLALLVEERSLRGEDHAKAVGLRSLTYHLGDLDCEVVVVPRGGTGAFIRFGGGKETRTAPNLARDFGSANLDCTFEYNRFRLAPERPGETALTITGKALAQVRNPLPALKLTQADLRRESGHNLLSSLVLRYAGDSDGSPALHKVALPLWATLGPGQFEGVSDDNGGHLALIWENTRTRYALRFPYDMLQPVELEASNQQGSAPAAEREAAAAAFDRRERKRRLDAHQEIVRLARHVEQLELGMTRNQVRQIVPPGQSVLKQDVPGGLVVTFRADPAQTAQYTLRQLSVRFDRSERVVELRARYVDGPSAGQGARWMTDMIQKIKKYAGAPSQEPSPWAKTWADLPPQKPAPLLYRWQDDITFLACQRDAAGVELALRDYSSDPELGQPPLWEYLPRGPANVQLGSKRGDLLKKWGVKNPVTTEDGALVLRPAQGSSFDICLVYFDDNDRAARIVARHPPLAANFTTPAQWSQALTDAWGRDFAKLGWPRRQDVTVNGDFQSLGWNDDRTRMRIFWQEAETTGPPRVFTEWKELTP